MGWHCLGGEGVVVVVGVCFFFCSVSHLVVTLPQLYIIYDFILDLEYSLQIFLRDPQISFI